MKATLAALLFFICLLFSCTGKEAGGVITFQVAKSDYIEKIYVTGTVQAVVNHPVTPPGMMYGQMTVLRLAAEGSFVKSGDTICVLSAPLLESMYQETRNTLDSLEAGLKKAEADIRLNIALLEAMLATSEAQMKISSLDSLRMKYTTELQRRLLELEIKKTLIEKEKTEKKLAASKLIAENDIKQINARIIQQRSKVQSMEDQVKALTITAGRDGMIMRTESPRFSIMGPQGNGTIGGPIKEGSVLFLNNPVLQFPDLSRMQISAEVAEADFKKVEKEQHVFITVDAAERLSTTGKVNRKNLIGRRSQMSSESKVKFYELIIDVDSCHERMKPGLSASCEIILSEAKDTLYVPSLAIFDRDSSKVVFVRKKESYIPVKVETGFSGSSYTIISGGLTGDEIIALSEPPNSLINDVEEEKKVRRK
jgi:multidrug efflux pump subunit AcrA (membrane-fusion protein)